MPVELARLEAAVLAAVAREAAGVAVDQVAHQLQVAPPLGRAGGDDLRLEQPVEAEQRRVATQFVAHQRVRRLGTLLFQRLLEHGVEQVRSEEHTSELQSHSDLVCRLLLEKKN